MVEQPPPAVSQVWQECRSLGARPDGALVVNLGGFEQELEPRGVKLPQPPSPAYFEFLSRLRGLPKPMRCHVFVRAQSGRVRADVLYFGWQDKSGDVWLSLAETLIEQGFASPAAEQMETP